MSMVCEMTLESVILGMFKINKEFLNKISENKKLDVKLVDLLSSENASTYGDFKVEYVCLTILN